MFRLKPIFLFCCAVFTLTQPVRVHAQTHVHKGDSALAPASYQYQDNSLAQRILLGSNYRDIWSQPVWMPLFRLSTSGLRIKELGGGQQTKSLKLLDDKGTEWTLRTIDKEVSKAVPEGLRNPLVISVVQDMISASFPYAPLSIPVLAQALDVKAANPRFYHVEDDPALGEYRELFAHKLCLLEKDEIIKDNDLAIDSPEMLANLITRQKESMDQEYYLKTRLLDLLVADWDRHTDQYSWQKAMANQYRPLPKDRDQAFFHSDGLLLKLASAFGLAHMRGFKTDRLKLTKLASKTHEMDRMLLNELSWSDWSRIIAEFQGKLSDEVIDQSLASLPRELDDKYSMQLADALKIRRDKMDEAALEYYLHLTDNMIVYGSDDAEKFELTKSSDQYQFKIISLASPGQVLYERLINPTEVSKLEIFGLGGNDIFTIHPEAFKTLDIQVDDNRVAAEWLEDLKTRIPIKD